LKEGMEIPVTVISIDKMKGRMGLSIKTDNPTLFKKPE